MAASEHLLVLGRDGDRSSLGMVMASTGVAVMGSFSFGVTIGYTPPTHAEITQDLQLTLSQYSVFGSILTIGAMVGAVASGYIADVAGRKGAMRFSVLFCVVGWLAIFFAQSAASLDFGRYCTGFFLFGRNSALDLALEYFRTVSAASLDFGRFCTGFGVGVFSYVVPVFIAEIAPKALRGMLTALNQLLVCTGLSVTYIVSTMVSWRMLATAGLVPCIILTVGLFSIPESPRWLAKIGQQKEFEIALQRLRGKHADVSLETEESRSSSNLLKVFQRLEFRIFSASPTFVLSLSASV